MPYVNDWSNPLDIAEAPFKLLSSPWGALQTGVATGDWGRAGEALLDPDRAVRGRQALEQLGLASPSSGMGADIAGMGVELADPIQLLALGGLGKAYGALKASRTASESVAALKAAHEASVARWASEPAWAIEAPGIGSPFRSRPAPPSLPPLQGPLQETLTDPAAALRTLRGRQLGDLLETHGPAEEAFQTIAEKEAAHQRLVNDWNTPNHAAIENLLRRMGIQFREAMPMPYQGAEARTATSPIAAHAYSYGLPLAGAAIQGENERSENPSDAMRMLGTGLMLGPLLGMAASPLIGKALHGAPREPAPTFYSKLGQAIPGLPEEIKGLPEVAGSKKVTPAKEVRVPAAKVTDPAAMEAKGFVRAENGDYVKSTPEQTQEFPGTPAKTAYEQLYSMLRNKGVNPEEIEWTLRGLEGEPSIGRGQLQQQFEHNGIRLEKKVLTEGSQEGEMAKSAREKYMAMEQANQAALAEYRKTFEPGYVPGELPSPGAKSIAAKAARDAAYAEMNKLAGHSDEWARAKQELDATTAASQGGRVPSLDDVDRFVNARNRFNRANEMERSERQNRARYSGSTWVPPGGIPGTYKESLTKLAEHPEVAKLRDPTADAEINEDSMRGNPKYTQEEVDAAHAASSEARRKLFEAQDKYHTPAHNYEDTAHYPGEKGLISWHNGDLRWGDDGKLIKFVNEVQSPAHQEARDVGYSGAIPWEKNPVNGGVSYKNVSVIPTKGRFEVWEGNKQQPTGDSHATLDAAKKYAEKLLSDQPVPNMPFKDNEWANMELKNILREAAEETYTTPDGVVHHVDRVAFSNGQLMRKYAGGQGEAGAKAEAAALAKRTAAGKPPPAMTYWAEKFLPSKIKELGAQGFEHEPLIVKEDNGIYLGPQHPATTGPRITEHILPTFKIPEQLKEKVLYKGQPLLNKPESRPGWDEITGEFSDHPAMIEVKKQIDELEKEMAQISMNTESTQPYGRIKQWNAANNRLAELYQKQRDIRWDLKTDKNMLERSNLAGQDWRFQRSPDETIPFQNFKTVYKAGEHYAPETIKATMSPYDILAKYYANVPGGAEEALRSSEEFYNANRGGVTSREVERKYAEPTWIDPPYVGGKGGYVSTDNDNSTHWTEVTHNQDGGTYTVHDPVLKAAGYTSTATFPTLENAKAFAEKIHLEAKNVYAEKYGKTFTEYTDNPETQHSQALSDVPLLHAAAKEPVNVYQFPFNDEAARQAAGVAYPGYNTAFLDVNSSGAMNTLEHELTHNMQGSAGGALMASIPTKPGRYADWKWLLDKREADTAIAGPAKRLMASQVGSLVKTPEDAEKALDFLEHWHDYSARQSYEQQNPDLAGFDMESILLGQLKTHPEYEAKIKPFLTSRMPAIPLSWLAGLLGAGTGAGLYLGGNRANEQG